MTYRSAVAVATLLATTTLVAHATAVPDTAQLGSDFANAVYGSADLMTATHQALQATQWVQGRTASAVSSQSVGSQTIDCPAGGNVSAAWVLNSSTGLPVFTLQFNQCAINSKLVVSGSYVQALLQQSTTRSCTNNRDLSTCMVVSKQDASNQFNNLSVSMPFGAVALNGLAETIVTTTTQGLQVNTRSELKVPDPGSLVWSTSYAFSDRASSFSVSRADITRVVNSSGGVKTDTRLSGMATLTLDPYQHAPMSLTVSFNGGVNFDANGLANNGTASLVLAPNTFNLSVVPGQATICADLGSDGVCDKVIAIDWTAIQP